MKLCKVKRASLFLFVTVFISACGTNEKESDPPKAKDIVIELDEPYKTKGDSAQENMTSHDEDQEAGSKSSTGESPVSSGDQSNATISNNNSQQIAPASEENQGYAVSQPSMAESESESESGNSGQAPEHNQPAQPSQPESGISSPSDDNEDSFTGGSYVDTPDGWISSDGYYHGSSYCWGNHEMTGEVMTWYEAETQGYLPCPDCIPR